MFGCALDLTCLGCGLVGCCKRDDGHSGFLRGWEFLRDDQGLCPIRMLATDVSTQALKCEVKNIRSICSSCVFS